MRKQTKRQATWQGGKWITPKRRLAIYLRDGMACCYCGAKVEDGAQLSLDHLTPDSKGGGNESTNLVTCCKKCNSSRGNRPVATFAKAVAEYLNTDAAAILRHVRNCSRRALPLDEAAELISRRKAA
jgi:5-methylcytosine-specific restriction endonuclease McrA